MRELDRRFARDIELLIDRDGARAFSLTIVQISEELGFRGLFEERVSQALRGMPRPRLRLVNNDDGPDAA